MYVLELGTRLGVGACGRLLADLGATVFVAEPRVNDGAGKWSDRTLATAGRQSILCDRTHGGDIDVLAEVAARCDVALISSDVDRWAEPLQSALAGCAIVCDITAFGAAGPLAGRAADELAIQGMTGLMHTTGFPDGPAVPIGLPVVEFLTGICAAVATTVAWRVLRHDGVGQRIDMALFDTAISTLTTFLPAHFAGKVPGRLGNGHSLSVPWNAYRAIDGWVVICSSTDVHWQQLATLISPELAADPRYRLLADRIERRTDVDAQVAAWVAGRHVEPLLQTLSDAGIAGGPIVPVADLPREPNLVFRRAIADVVDPVSQRHVRVPGTLIHFDDQWAPGPAIPAPDSGRTNALRLAPSQAHVPRVPRAPLAGVRVIEIGQYTTAPLAARHLASFGADVIKIEPAGGDSARLWAPHRHGTSHFFVMTNGEKRSLALDLRSDEGRAAFVALLTGADVLVENMKPGSLEHLGFSYERLRALNPRLIYCEISGFGMRSVYKGRPAFDTVVQAMSGIMDAIGADGRPLKSGISVADIAGAQIGLFAIAAALEHRDRSGRGTMIDISMQDVGAWLTQTLWNTGRRMTDYAGQVATIAGACAHPQVLARELIVRRVDAEGTEWEMLGSPLKLDVTPPCIGTPLGRPVSGAMTWREENIGDLDAMTIA